MGLAKKQQEEEVEQKEEEIVVDEPTLAGCVEDTHSLATGLSLSQAVMSMCWMGEEMGVHSCLYLM